MSKTFDLNLGNAYDHTKNLSVAIVSAGELMLQVDNIALLKTNSSSHSWRLRVLFSSIQGPMVVATEVPELSLSLILIQEPKWYAVYIFLCTAWMRWIPSPTWFLGREKKISLSLAPWHEKQFTAMKSKEVSKACMKRTGCLQKREELSKPDCGLWLQ